MKRKTYTFTNVSGTAPVAKLFDVPWPVRRAWFLFHKRPANDRVRVEHLHGDVVAVDDDSVGGICEREIEWLQRFGVAYVECWYEK